MKTLAKSLRNIVAGALVTFGALAATSATAGAVFTVNPNSNGLSNGGVTFNANTMSGDSSARVTTTDGLHYTSDGYIVYSGFSLGSNPVSVVDSRLGFDYRLYATFHQTFTCAAGLSPGAPCAINSIQLDLFGDAGTAVADRNVFHQSTLAANPWVETNGAQVLLGTVNTIISGLAGIDTLGGAYQNVNTNFQLTTEGKLFFIAPVPFYTLAFSAFNNTSQGLQCAPSCNNAQTLAINSESGITDFNRVPEPASLALFGLALAGVAGARRRKSK